MKTYEVIGLMSGTSLDGLDIAAVKLCEQNEKWSFEFIATETVEYTDGWREKLAGASALSALEFVKLDIEFGHFTGKLVNDFILRNRLKPILVASHGHTVFHNPSEGYTTQIGNGHAIASHLECAVVADFRSLDVVRGGQGAPLVPMGDQLLFSQFDACINIGGFANISIQSPQRKAWDICPANIVLNEIAKLKGRSYDADGAFAQSGHLIEDLLIRLEQLDYYRQPPPKTLGREWVEKEVLPIIDFNMEPNDLLATFTHHIALRIAAELANCEGKVLITGGGALNHFLIETISKFAKCKIEVPDYQIVMFKEALVFGLLGLLRFQNRSNIDGKLTGSKIELSGGVVYKNM